MKALTFFLFSLMIMFCTSCDTLDGDGDKDYYDIKNLMSFSHNVFFSFQDSLGNDLVKGLEYDWWRSDLYPDEPDQVVVNSDLYTLDISFSDPYMDPGYYPNCPKFIDGLAKNIRYEVMQFPLIVLRKADGYQYINIPIQSGNFDFIDIPRDIIFKLTCPHIFGDDKPREIVTSWIDYNGYTKYTGQLFCTNVEFDGKKYIPNNNPKLGWVGEDTGSVVLIIR